MCIRDSGEPQHAGSGSRDVAADHGRDAGCGQQHATAQHDACLLYTSDAADERSSVDLGGRRIIKKKTR